MVSSISHKESTFHGDLGHEDHHRSLPRRSVLWRAYIHVNGHKFSCQIRNLSVGGLKIKLDIPFKNDVMGVVEIPKFDLSLKAKIAWQSEGFFGVEFLDDHALVREQFQDGAAVVGIDAVHFMNVLT